MRFEKYLIVLVVANTLVWSALQAQSPTGGKDWGISQDDATATNWRAQWIWMPEDEDADMLLARKTFRLSGKKERAVLSITASSRYELFINGNYIGSGPARSAPHHQSFDVLDIADALSAGENVLAIRVHHQREGVSFYGASRAGLLAQLDFSPGALASPIQTDGSWRVWPDERWQNASPRMARFHLEDADRMDLRLGSERWSDLDFDDSRWLSARTLSREIGWPAPQKNDRPTHLTPPWTSLVARDIPYLKESVTKAGQPVYASSIPAPKGGADFSADRWIDVPVISRIRVSGRGESAVDDNGPVAIPANDKDEIRTVVYDLGDVQNGRPFLDIDGPAGTVVDIMSAPYLLNESVQSPIVASTYVDRIVLSGEREQWEAFYMKPTRWLAVVFRHLPEAATLFGAGLMRSEYPFEQKGLFEVPDAPELQTLWDAAARTLRVCATDAYTDNYRERRQYAQTAYYANLGNYPVFGDTDLQRRYLKQIAEEQLADGLMPAYAPRHGNDFMVILDSNCFWIRGLHQYLLYSGDRATTRELLPAARKLLQLLHGYTNADGLIDNPPQSYWLDHALIDRRGANVCLNGHYLGALEDFAQTLEWLEELDSEIYMQRAQKVRKTVREQAWDPEEGLFADALIDRNRSEQFSEHGNAMAMALKIADSAQMKQIAARLSKVEKHSFVRSESGLVMVTPAMSYFLHAGLCEAGYADESWELAWDRFGHMLERETNGTLWEEWWLDRTGRSGRVQPVDTGRSDAQTESAFFPGLFARYILGIEPTQPGLEEVVLRYYPSNRLLQRNGAIPTPRGLLEVAWDVGPAAIEITVATPTNTRVRIDLASLGMPTVDQLTINGDPVSAEQIEDGSIILLSGNNTVLVEQ